jgi:hypothetical protein
LRQWRQILRRHVEGPRGVRLVLGNVDGTQPGAVHAAKRSQVVAFVDDGDVHRHPDFIGLGARALDDLLCGTQGHVLSHRSSFAPDTPTQQTSVTVARSPARDKLVDCAGRKVAVPIQSPRRLSIHDASGAAAARRR